MGSVPSELSLDLGPTFVPKTISDFLRDVSTNGNLTDKVLKLDDFVQRLEDEMKKIDAFKRELPLCMLLLNDAILILKEESLQCRRPNSQPVLEEFIPLKKECEQNEEHKKEKDCRDKKNWMSSVQLWNSDDFPTTNDTCEPKQNSKIENKKNEEESGLAAENLFPSCINRKAGMLFMPFKSYSGVPLPTVVRKEQKEELPIPGLSLLTPRIKNLREESGSSGSGTSCSRGVSSSGPSAQSKLQTGPRQPTARKQRRCWSPELHRRFVNALQQLGGSHAATPKQIRELMQVDGLTNDEVKSHLQKYRLHTRRPPAAAASPTNQSVVVLGGLWMPQDLYGDSSKGSSSQSGSPQGPLQLERSGGGTSLVGSDSMDDDEDAKSESYSWKTHVHVPEKVDI